MNYEDFRAPAHFNDAYLPSPIKKSVNILKLQQKWASDKPSSPPAKRNFSSYRDIEKPPFEILDSPGKRSHNPVLDSPVKSYRSYDSPKSVIPRPVVCKVRFVDDDDHVVPESPRPPAEKKVDQTPKASARKPNSPKSASSPSPRKNVASKAKNSLGNRTFPRWEFGKSKQFDIPVSSARTNKAATTIQRLARGGMQRLHYKIQRYEWLLQTRDERTQADVTVLKQKFDAEKKKYRAKVEEESKKESRLLKQTCKTAEESQKLIAYLRQENKKLREKNQKVHDAIVNLKQQNARLDGANQVTDGSLNTLKDHAKTVEETHAKLMEVIPKYKESIATMTEASQTRRQYGEAEHKIRLLYVKLLGEIFERLEMSTTEQAMAEEVERSMLELEEQQLAKGHLLSPWENDSHSRGLALESSCDGSDSDDDDSVDAYTVHTLDD